MSESEIERERRYTREDMEGLIFMIRDAYNDLPDKPHDAKETLWLALDMMNEAPPR